MQIYLSEYNASSFLKSGCFAIHAWLKTWDLQQFYMFLGHALHYQKRRVETVLYIINEHALSMSFTKRKKKWGQCYKSSQSSFVWHLISVNGNGMDVDMRMFSVTDTTNLLSAEFSIFNVRSHFMSSLVERPNSCN